MARTHKRNRALLCLAALLPLSCAHRGAVRVPPAAAGSGALAREISEQIADQYRLISDFKATVLLSATLGRRAGKVRRYPGVRGFLLYRKPADLRLTGAEAIAGLQMFDLVAQGAEFRISLPTRNRFLVGPNDNQSTSSGKLEDIRPQHLLEVLLPKPADPERESAAVEEEPGGHGYVLQLGRAGRPSRSLWIDAASLRVTREVIFDARGGTLTDARYSQWSAESGILFPRRLEIGRPAEDYELSIQVRSLEINRGLAAGAFVLEQPPGARLVTLGPR